MAAVWCYGVCVPGTAEARSTSSSNSKLLYPPAVATYRRSTEHCTAHTGGHVNPNEHSRVCTDVQIASVCCYRTRLARNSTDYRMPLQHYRTTCPE
eukprot:3470701-Rhodomonas_salina.3